MNDWKRLYSSMPGLDSPWMKLFSSGRVTPKIPYFATFARHIAPTLKGYNPAFNPTLQWATRQIASVPANGMRATDAARAYATVFKLLRLKRAHRWHRAQRAPSLSPDERLARRMYLQSYFMGSTPGRLAVFGRPNSNGYLTIKRGDQPAAVFQNSQPGRHRFDWGEPARLNLTLPRGWSHSLNGLPPVITDKQYAVGEQAHSLVVEQQPVGQDAPWIYPRIREDGLEGKVFVHRVRVLVRKHHTREVSEWLYRVTSVSPLFEFDRLTLKPQQVALLIQELRTAILRAASFRLRAA